jgi:hypothetical protein
MSVVASTTCAEETTMSSPPNRLVQHRQVVDVAEGADPERGQAVLGRPVEPDVHGVTGQRRDQDRDPGEQAGGPHQAGVGGVAGQALVDRLLHRDGHDDAAGRRGQRQQDRDEQALAELRGQAQSVREGREGAALQRPVVDAAGLGRPLGRRRRRGGHSTASSCWA